MSVYEQDLLPGDALLSEEEKSLALWRRKEGEEVCDGQESCDFVTTINDLPESLLSDEVFDKLDNPRDFFTCKSVCKCWNTVISSSGFRHDPGFALIVNTPALDQQKGEPHYATEDSIFTSLRGFELKYLHCFDSGSEQPVCVQASCEDMLLCTESYKTQSVFYIVNPLTARWYRLPDTPSRRSNWTFPVGLALKVHGGLSSDDSAQFRYKVVRVICFRHSKFRAEVFDSETKSWTVKRVRYPVKPMNGCPTHYQGLAFNGVLHWLIKDGPIIAFDPFDPDQKTCEFIFRCDEMYYDHYETATITECLTTSEGYLIILQVLLFPIDSSSGNEANRLCVWVSMDSGWWLFEEIYFKDMISDIPWLREYMHEYFQRHTQYKMLKLKKSRACIHTHNVKNPKIKEAVHRPEPLACHPNDMSLVYLHLPHTIVTCDLSSKKLKIISEISPHLESSYYDTIVPTNLKLSPTSVPLM